MMRLIVSTRGVEVGTATVVNGKGVLDGPAMTSMKGAAVYDPLTPAMWKPDPATHPTEWLRALAYCFMRNPGWVLTWEEDGEPVPGPFLERSE